MSRKKRETRKPSQPAGMAVLPKRGPAYVVSEDLPEAKDDLEFAVVEKLVRALAQSEKRYLPTAPWQGWVSRLSTVSQRDSEDL